MTRPRSGKRPRRSSPKAPTCCARTPIRPAIVQVVQEKGIYAFGWDSDMRKFATQSQLTANTNNWGVYYIDTVKKVLAGTWKPEVVKWGLKEGVVVMAPLNSVVLPAVAKVFEEKKKAIIDGKLTPFQGPVKDESGAVKVPAGSTMPLEELMEPELVRRGRGGLISQVSVRRPLPPFAGSVLPLPPRERGWG